MLGWAAAAAAAAGGGGQKQFVMFMVSNHPQLSKKNANYSSDF